MRLEDFRPRFQPFLDEFIARKTRVYTPLARDEFLQQLLDYPSKLAGAGGKRIRPYVAYLMFRSHYRGDDDNAIRALVSLELFHLFCLVHDDIIDKGTQRYGLPTIHQFAADAMRRDERRSQPEHIGTAHATLIGDLLFSWSHEAFADGGFCGERLEKARERFGLMIDEVVIGQMLDVDLMTRRETTRDVIESKIELKTASYTFIRPMQIGATLAGGECDGFCSDLGKALGMAFQVQDDLLDIIGTPRTTKKTLFADLRDGTHTLLTQHILENGNSNDMEELRELMGANLNDSHRDRVIELFTRTGALDEARDIVDRNLRQAMHLLNDGTLRPEERDGFCHLVAILEARDKK